MHLSVGNWDDCLSREVPCIAVADRRLLDLPLHFQQMSLPGDYYIAWRRQPFPPRLDGYLRCLADAEDPRRPLPDHRLPPPSTPIEQSLVHD